MMNNGGLQYTFASSPNGELVTFTLKVHRVGTLEVEIESLGKVSEQHIHFSPGKTGGRSVSRMT